MVSFPFSEKCLNFAGRGGTEIGGKEGKVPVQTFWNRRWREVWIRIARLG